ncbi:PREDICTED: cyclic nucleotide-binding domain-containing protein 2 [Nanorana parkeri]|uniref:cyclic nucleotide-binding domain-containing protein 2 n=1 Tax=Nanorana parkeri TaxID=125878 RepID=UPI000854F6E9|nr:PREDICTED: cyclic nucleotide-binding domain-containing protein 2 [Nanorana parkeri]
MFKRLAQDIKMKCKVCKVFRHQLKGLTEFQIVMTARSSQDAVSVEEETEQRKMFDLNLFKNRQDRFPRKAELITLRKPKWRTETEIKYLCSLLQTLRSYQLYSSHLQMLLAKVFRFERFGCRRVIIRKGHIGSSFYFIYSGSVALCNDEDGSSAFLDQEPQLLHKGAKFGDIGMVTGQKRNVTVVCMSETEFLVVDKKDFFANKLDQQLHKEFQCRFDYFRSLDIFSHWPPEHIKNIAENCQAGEFRYGQLIIQDTRESKSIAFITEGTCEVLRLVKLIKCPSYHRWLRASLSSQHSSLPEKLSHTIQKPPKDVTEKCYQPLEPSCVKPSSQQPHWSGTSKMHAQKLSALKEAVMLCCSETSADCDIILLLTGSQGMLNQKMMQHSTGSVSSRSGAGTCAVGAALTQFQSLHDDDQKDERSLMLNLAWKWLIKDYCTSILCSDDILCKFFLQQNDWKMFKRDLVNLLVKPLNHQAEKKRRAKHFQPPPSLSQSGILDLCSTFPKKKETNATSEPKGMYGSTQERRQNPSDRNVYLVHEIVVPRPRLDRILF